MAEALLVLIPIALLAFWACMFFDLTKNDNLRSRFITLSGWRDARVDWNVAFIFLKMMAASFHDAYEYRYRHQARYPA